MDIKSWANQLRYMINPKQRMFIIEEVIMNQKV